jgi:NADH-quinone oxidoreductase subunit I/electron transport complex protein RnfC
MTIEIQRGKVIQMDRRPSDFNAGQGLMKGLGVIWRHWVASFRRLDKASDIQGTFTVEYPDERLELPEAFRNMPILLYDDATGHELCTSCFQCQRICPPQVIHMTQAKDPATGKAVPAVTEFVIEYDACMSCGFCAEVCPFDAIKMDHDFELSTADHGGLTVNKVGLNRPISYYEAIAPTMWAEVKDGAYKKLQGNMKRRSGLIGVAPNFKQPAKPAAPTAAARPAAATARAAARPAAPVAAVGKNMSEEKAARLAAIRAANAAKGGGEASPAAAVEAVETLAAAPDDPALGAAGAGSQPEAGAAPSTAPIAAVGANMSEEKAARLAAIRAANAAKKQE